jgi:hypothetical protein
MSTQDHNAAIARHDEDIRELRRDVGQIFTEIKGQNASLAGIANAITELKAQRGPGFLQLLDVASRVVTLVGAMVVGIVYLSTNGQSPAQHAIDKRATILEYRADQAKQLAEAEIEKRLSVYDWRMKRLEDELRTTRTILGWKPVPQTN